MKKQALQPSTMNLVQNTNEYRAVQQGIAIDSPGTHRPEDAVHATPKPDGSFDFAASIVEVGLLDKNGLGIRRLIGQLAAHYRAPEIAMPQDRGIFYFYSNRFMPALTLTGNFRADRGLTNLDIVRTKLMPKHFEYNSPALREDRDYHNASRFVHAFRKYYHNTTHLNPKRSFMRPARTIETFSNLVNIATAELTRSAGLPQLLHAYPAVVTLEDGREITTTQVTAEPHGHELLQVDAYTGVTNPIRDERNWINQVAITHFMETGDSILNHDEAMLIAGWFNKLKHQRLERRNSSSSQTFAA